jgi:predicted transcriptional regulator
MNIQAEKLKIIEWILGIQDKALIDQLSNLKNKIAENKDWADDLNRLELASIERGLKDLSEGKIHTHADVMKTYEKYL